MKSRAWRLPTLKAWLQEVSRNHPALYGNCNSYDACNTLHVWSKTSSSTVASTSQRNSQASYRGPASLGRVPLSSMRLIANHAQRTGSAGLVPGLDRLPSIGFKRRWARPSAKPQIGRPIRPKYFANARVVAGVVVVENSGVFSASVVCECEDCSFRWY